MKHASSLLFLASFAASATAVITTNDNCKESTYGSVALHWGAFSWTASDMDWLVADPGLEEGAILKFASKDSDYTEPNLGYYSQTVCNENVNDSGYRYGAAGFLGLASDTDDNYSGLRGDLCLTASGVNVSDITISLQKCEYAEGRTDAPIVTQNFQVDDGLIYIGSIPNAFNVTDTDTKVNHYTPRIDEEGILKFDYSEEGYPYPQLYKTGKVWAITLSGAD